MAATAAHCIAANDLSSNVEVLHADVRHLNTPLPVVGQRLPAPVNLVVYEVESARSCSYTTLRCWSYAISNVFHDVTVVQQLFDAGLLGENVLPILAHVHEHLSATDAPRLIPRGAQVYCQLLQYEEGPGTGAAYEAVDLQHARYAPRNPINRRSTSQPLPLPGNVPISPTPWQCSHLILPSGDPTCSQPPTPHE